MIQYKHMKKITSQYTLPYNRTIQRNEEAK